ncbi:MAG: DUF4116 domain-containing protein [Parachlamydiaceae bacterium]|nr:DUF4116 domain-containing protein [Parachlamydiaceae bacterium]
MSTSSVSHLGSVRGLEYIDKGIASEKGKIDSEFLDSLTKIAKDHIDKLKDAFIEDMDKYFTRSLNLLSFDFNEKLEEKEKVCKQEKLEEKEKVKVEDASSDSKSGDTEKAAGTVTTKEISDADDEFIVRATFLAIVEKKPEQIKKLPNKLQLDRSLMLAAVNVNGLALQFLIKRFKEDSEFVGAAILHNPLALEHAPEKYQLSKDAVLVAANKNGLAIKFASNNCKKDPVLALKAIQTNPQAFKYINKKLKKDPAFIKAAVCKNGLVLKYLPAIFKNDKELAKLAIIENVKAFRYVSKELKDDVEIVTMVVRRNGLALQHASYNLRENVTIAEIAVAQNGLALKYVSEKLSKDLKLVRIAVNENSWALLYASPEIRKFKLLILELVKKDGMILQVADLGMAHDPEIVREAAIQNHESIRFAPASMISDRNFMLSIVERNGLVQEFSLFKNDKEFIIAAIKNNLRASLFIPKDFESAEVSKILREEIIRQKDKIPLKIHDKKEFLTTRLIPSSTNEAAQVERFTRVLKDGTMGCLMMVRDDNLKTKCLVYKHGENNLIVPNGYFVIKKTKLNAYDAIKAAEKHLFVTPDLLKHQEYFKKLYKVKSNF